jgi:heme-degrading monooxygenase HmoA
MYAVIFKAQVAELDDEYRQVAKRMRQLASEKYGCTGFISVTEGNEEIAISYWENEKQIKEWKCDPEHIGAQEKGKSKWYKSYQVQVVKVLRDYASNK